MEAPLNVVLFNNNILMEKFPVVLWQTLILTFSPLSLLSVMITVLSLPHPEWFAGTKGLNGLCVWSKQILNTYFYQYLYKNFQKK